MRFVHRSANVGVERLAISASNHVHPVPAQLTTATVLHLHAFSLRDHLEAVTIAEVRKLPRLKSSLSCAHLLLLDKLDQLHG